MQHAKHDSGDAAQVRETSEGSNQKFKIPLGQITQMHSKRVHRSSSKQNKNLNNSGNSSKKPIYSNVILQNLGFQRKTTATAESTESQKRTDSDSQQSYLRNTSASEKRARSKTLKSTKQAIGSEGKGAEVRAVSNDCRDTLSNKKKVPAKFDPYQAKKAIKI